MRVSDDASATRPLPSLLPGFLELVSPVSIGTMRRLRLPLFVSAPSLCGSVCDTSAPRLFSLTSDRGGVGCCSGPCVTGVVLSGNFRGDSRLSQLPETPCTAMPCSYQTPGGLPRLTMKALRYCPHLSYDEGSPLLHFRGSVTRLCSSLPTLEDVVSERQPRLASGCWSGFSGRIGSRRVSVETFIRSFFLVVLSLF